MRLLATLRTLILVPVLALAAASCTQPVSAAIPSAVPDSHPLVGKWIDVENTDSECQPSFEFRDDGALVMSDIHGSKTYDGTLSTIDAVGYYTWSGRFRAAGGKQKCLGDESVKDAPMQLYARLVHAGAHLTLCESESIETCHVYLGRSPDRPARATRPGDLGLAEPLGTAIEHASAAPGAVVSLAAADASTPLFIVAGQPATLQCEQLGAWSIFTGSLLGTVTGARCANATHATQLAEEALADPELAALVGRGAAQLPGMALARETLEDGSTLSYFPVLAMGHGVVVLWTATLVDKAKSSAVVIQATTTQACPEVPRADTPRLCRDPKGFVIDVARALAASTTR